MQKTQIISLCYKFNKKLQVLYKVIIKLSHKFSNLLRDPVLTNQLLKSEIQREIKKNQHLLNRYTNRNLRILNYLNHLVSRNFKMILMQMMKDKRVMKKRIY